MKKTCFHCENSLQHSVYNCLSWIRNIVQKYIFLNFVFRIHKLIRIMEVKHIYENSKVLHSKENKLFHLYLKIVRRILVRFRAEIFYFSDFLPVNLLWKKKKKEIFPKEIQKCTKLHFKYTLASKLMQKMETSFLPIFFRQNSAWNQKNS